MDSPVVNYRAVFDITDAGFKSWTFSAHGLIFVVIGIVLVLSRKTVPGRWAKNPGANLAFVIVYLGFAIVWTISSFLDTRCEYVQLATAVREGRAEVAEGIVTNFKPMPVSGHAMESFCVSGRCFSYSDFVISAGFNNTASHGGPIREGLRVRVTFVGNEIAKLEVAD